MKRRSILFPLFACSLLAASVLACAVDLNTGDAHARRGIDAYKAGEYDAAIDELEQAVDAEVSEYELEEIYTILGNAYLETGRFDEAVAAHKKAIEVNPEFHKAWVNLGIAYRHIGDLEKAEECYTEALRIEPDYAELHASLGALYIVKGEPEKAVEALEKATELDSQLAVAYSNLALAYAMVGRFEDADVSLRQAVVLGYENWAAVQERIDDLKALEE
jgi:tetratricopeptide (TPR) repeat protein